MRLDNPTMTENKQSVTTSLSKYISSIPFPAEIFPAQDLTSVFRYLVDHPAAFSRVTRKNREAGVYTEQLTRAGDIVHSIETIGPITDVSFVVYNHTKEQVESGACFKESGKDVHTTKLTSILDGILELHLPVIWLSYSYKEIRYTAPGVHTFRINYITIRQRERDTGFRVLTSNGEDVPDNTDKSACQGMEIILGDDVFVIDRFRLIWKRKREDDWAAELALVREQRGLTDKE
jgi:hypothetical protein